MSLYLCRGTLLNFFLPFRSIHSLWHSSMPASPWKRLECSIGKPTHIKKKQADHAWWKRSAGILPRGLYIAICGKQIGRIKNHITSWCPFPHHSRTFKIDTLLAGLILKFDAWRSEHTWFSSACSAGRLETLTQLVLCDIPVSDTRTNQRLKAIYVLCWVWIL